MRAADIVGEGEWRVRTKNDVVTRMQATDPLAQWYHGASSYTAETRTANSRTGSHCVPPALEKYTAKELVQGNRDRNFDHADVSRRRHCFRWIE